MILKTRCFIGSDKYSMWELGEKLGLKGKALGMFRHACSKVECDLEVDSETGEAKIVSIEGRKVES